MYATALQALFQGGKETVVKNHRTRCDKMIRIIRQNSVGTKVPAACGPPQRTCGRYGYAQSQRKDWAVRKPKAPTKDIC